jgi:hypothetical protein
MTLKLWRECCQEYYKGEKCKSPKQGSPEYKAIKKIYDARKNRKNCKCRCPCKCPKDL